MKYFEIKAKINTFFVYLEETKEKLLNDKKSLTTRINETREFINKNVRDLDYDYHSFRHKNYARMSRDSNSFDFIKELNEKLDKDNNENLSCIALYENKREVLFAVKTIEDKDANKIIANLNKKILKYIEQTINSLLFDEDDRVMHRNNEESTNEVYYNTEFNYNEISFKEFYFTDLCIAYENNYDLENYYNNTKEHLFASDPFKYEEIDSYMKVYDLDTSLDEKAFKKKYRELLYNKSFKDEIDRIFLPKFVYEMYLYNPVHYEFSSSTEDDRIYEAKALAEALYIAGRIKSPKLIKLDIDMDCSYINKDLLLLILNNSINSFVLIDFENESEKKHTFRPFRYYKLDDNAFIDIIEEYKHDVTFGIYVDRYDKNLKYGLSYLMRTLDFVKFDDKLMPNKALSYVKKMAKKYNIEVTKKLSDMIEISKNDLTKKEAKIIFDNYKDEVSKNGIFKEYKDYFEGKGNVDNAIDPYDELMGMTGLKNIKNVIDEVLAYDKLNKYKNEYFIKNKTKKKILESVNNGNTVPMNMMFMGNPGTCKTTVARLVAKILYSRGIIKNNKTIVYKQDREGLRSSFKMAYGGVLFIDEAYGLSYYEVNQLVELMENNRKDVVVILAGYTNEMKSFLNMNDGLNSRFKYLVEFEDYNENELWEILNYQAKKENLSIDSDAKEKLLSIFSTAQCNKKLGNGRLVRNILDMAISNQAKRYKDIDFEKNNIDAEELQVLHKEDFDVDIKKLTGKTKKEQVDKGDPEIELESMIGLDKVKELVRKVIASARINKIRNNYNETNDKKLITTAMHLAFLGNPGTCKTTVARLLARILKKKGIIKKDEIVEVGRKDLVGKYVGHTAPLVESVFNKAKGGVLFIDEAYSLLDDKEGQFGDEAINTIIAQMENHRDDVIVIFAGYTDKMRKFISRNEGLRSRLSYVIEFDDYNSEELIKIFEKMINDIGYTINDDAMEIVKQKLYSIAKDKDYGNGRYVRKLIENAKLNMDLRLNEYEDNDLSYVILTTFEASDFKEIMDDNVLNDKKKNPIGFAA